jgi:hypothetical protein
MNSLQTKINELLSYDPFQLDNDIKKKLLINIMREQIIHHTKSCEKYRNWYLSNNFKAPDKISEYQDIPFLPSSVFKLTSLKSVKDVKKIQSSGTTSSNKSTVFIDKQTSINQVKTLSKILSNLLDSKKRNFFIIDVEPEKYNPDQVMSARQAGMAGYLMGAKTKNYLLRLDEKKNIIIDSENFEKLVNESQNNSVVIIGYTYMLYKHFLNNPYLIKKNPKIGNNAKIIHFGGWKKLQDKNISKKLLLQKIKNSLDISESNVYDIYGFTEQLGTVYISQGTNGCRVSSYSHVLVRDVKSLEVLKEGQTGFLQFISPLPMSYPGFSILNDDLGKINLRAIGKGNNEIIEFLVNPRLDNAEDRGCGDTLPANYYI